MKLFNTQTREVDEIDDEEGLKNALLTGTHSYESGAQVSVRNADGELGTVPSENIVKALQSGFSVETPTQRQVREYVDANKGMKGALKVGLGQLGDEALMGLPETVFQKTGDPLEVAKADALKKEHGLANTAGGIGGFAASLFIGGPIWKAGSKAGVKTAEIVAEKLAVRAGEEVGTRTVATAAKEIVKNMTAKAAGAGAEGAVVSMPHAITEAALGDPEDAAETLLAGVGVGALFGGGGVLAKEFATLSKDVAAKGVSMVTGQQENAKSLARKAAKVLTGVPEDDIEHYLLNADRVNLAPEVEAIEFGIGEARAKYSSRAEALKENAAYAKREADEGYKAAKMDLARQQAPETVARSGVQAVDDAKGILGQWSDEADDLLDVANLSFQRDDILAAIDKTGAAIGVKSGKGKTSVLISDEDVTAVNKLMAQRERIASLPETLDGPMVREVLRAVRKDINYNQMAGEFNDTLNKARKTFTEQISNVLKVQVPKYGTQMEKMSKLSESVRKMSKLMGDERRAVGTLNTIFTPKGSLNKQIVTEFGELTGRDFIGELAAFERSKKLLELSRIKDIREQLVPELSGKAARLETEHAAAVAALEPFKRLTPERVQAVIRNQGFKNANNLDRQALEALGGAEGVNFVEQIRDRNVLNGFSKDRTQGSRRTLLGTVLGSVAGGGVGGVLGGVVGATVDTHGGVILKKILDANRDVSGLLFTEKAMKRVAERLDDVPGMLSRMAKKATPKNIRAPAPAGLARLLAGHDEDAGQKRLDAIEASPRLKNLEKFNEKASILVSNPDKSVERMASLSGPIANGGAPLIGEAFGRKASAAITYLHSQSPKPPRPRSPFAAHIVYQPPAHELAAFEDKVQIATDPFTALDELEHGTLTKSHVDALKAIYPGLYNMIQTRVQSAVVNGVEPMAYAQRVKLSMLLDTPMDVSLTPAAITYYQEAHVASEAAAAEQASGGEFKAAVNITDGVMSQADRITNRGAKS